MSDAKTHDKAEVQAEETKAADAPKFGFVEVDGAKFGIWKRMTPLQGLEMAEAISAINDGVEEGGLQISALMVEILRHCLDKDYRGFKVAFNGLDLEPEEYNSVLQQIIETIQTRGEGVPKA